jgi:hypothetical protein
MVEMGSRETNGVGRERELDREIERYRQAATVALDALAWCINYLHGQRKTSIARTLERNRKQIVERIR